MRHSIWPRRQLGVRVGFSLEHDRHVSCITQLLYRLGIYLLHVPLLPRVFFLTLNAFIFLFFSNSICTVCVIIFLRSTFLPDRSAVCLINETKISKALKMHIRWHVRLMAKKRKRYTSLYKVLMILLVCGYKLVPFTRKDFATKTRPVDGHFTFAKRCAPRAVSAWWHHSSERLSIG